MPTVPAPAIPPTAYPVVKLKPVARFREFPFGTRSDPSIRDFMAERPWSNQDKVVEYLRSGLIFGIAMGGVTDTFDRSSHAHAVIDGRSFSGLEDMTDGEWYWPVA